MDVQEYPGPTDRAPAQQFEPIFELGGPAYRLMQRIGIIKGSGPSIGRRSIAFIAITWLPLLLLSIWQGSVIGPTPRSSFLLDFATYARFFLAVPLIFAAESVVGPQIRQAGLRFVQSDIVRPEDYPAFARAVARVRRRRDAALPEILFLIGALIGAWFLAIETWGGLDVETWHSMATGQTVRLAPAGIWYYFVAIPLVQFFSFRWVWRLVIWTLFLWEMSRLPLNLSATHADMAGGLGFLGVAHVSLSIFPFAVSSVFAAELAFRIVFESADSAALRSMAPLLITYLVFIELAIFGPLLVVVPLLAGIRRRGLRAYGMLVQRHNQLFHDKWINGNRQAGELPLGSPDMSSLIDLASSFDIVRRMSVFPAGRRQLIQVTVIACLPAVPLVFLLLPFAEVLKLLVGIII
ncbi:MAG: hypothetical protein B7Z80_06000 [Rhodospirillales bacterium 20-64-7]|nr:MAG: hypothetical protein B7Z80_06000 [Rhodospirillales bacterium 20-64-7]HQT77229.1 hypothetical protein [Rhodopila sp.]